MRRPPARRSRRTGVPAYLVEFAASVARDLRRLSPTLLARFDERITALAADLRGAGAQKLTGLDAHRARVGEYRIVYEIDDVGRILTVTRIRHRRDVYRTLR